MPKTLFAIGLACRQGLGGLARIGALLMGAVHLVKLALGHRLADDGAEDEDRERIRFVLDQDAGQRDGGSC